MTVLSAAGAVSQPAPAIKEAAGVVTSPSPQVLAQLAPKGRLRAAINLGNGVLAQGKPDALRGASVDLARELSRRTGLTLELVPFPAAGRVFEALKDDAWDVAFFAIEPVRAAQVEFTTPYVLIEGTYMVQKSSPLKDVGDVDKPGHRIAVGKASAYDLFLTRTVKHATIVRARTGGGRAMIDLFLAEKLDAAAGVRQALAAYAKTDPEVRIMDGHFMVIEQAMGVPKGRSAAAAYLRDFIEEMKASGFVAAALERSGQMDAKVAPPASR